MDHLRLFPSNLSLLAARPARGTDNAVLLRSVELSGAEAHVHSPSQLPEAGLGYADLPQGQDYGARALDRQSTSKIQLCAHLPSHVTLSRVFGGTDATFTRIRWLGALEPHESTYRPLEPFGAPAAGDVEAYASDLAAPLCEVEGSCHTQAGKLRTFRVIFPPWTQLYLHAGHTQACGTLLQPATGRLISTNSTEQVELTTDTMRLPVKGVLYWVRAADHEKGQKGELYVRYAALIEVVAAVRCYRKDDRRHYLPLLVPQVLGLDVQQYPAACLITTGGVEYVAATPPLEAAVQEQLDLQFRTAADAQARAARPIGARINGAASSSSSLSDTSSDSESDTSSDSESDTSSDSGTVNVIGHPLGGSSASRPQQKRARSEVTSSGRHSKRVAHEQQGPATGSHAANGDDRSAASAAGAGGNGGGDVAGGSGGQEGQQLQVKMEDGDQAPQPLELPAPVNAAAGAAATPAPAVPEAPAAPAAAPAAAAAEGGEPPMAPAAPALPPLTGAAAELGAAGCQQRVEALLQYLDGADVKQVVPADLQLPLRKVARRLSMRVCAAGPQQQAAFCDCWPTLQFAAGTSAEELLAALEDLEQLLFPTS